MNSVSLGDLSQSFMMQRRSVALREAMGKLTEELSTGKVSDLKQVLSGNHNYLSDLERSLVVLQGYSVANSEAAYLTASMQASLTRVQDFAGQLGLDLILAGGGPVGVIAGSPSENAKTQLQGMMNSLNSDIAGRGLFSGAATDQPALPNADTLIDELRTVVAGAGSPEDILATAENWFMDPAGFDTVIYSGSDTSLAPFSLSDTERVSLDIRANDPALKQALLLTAVAALADDPTLALSVAQQSELFGTVGLELQSNQDKLTDLRSGIGVVEARIEMISIRNQAEETSIEFARNALLLADPFETATELENVQFQLQGLYSVTVRSSQLSLVNFL